MSIPIVDDDLLELPEDFFGDLSFLVQNPSNVVIDPAITRVLINDNDSKSLVLLVIRGDLILYIYLYSLQRLSLDSWTQNTQ